MFKCFALVLCLALAVSGCGSSSSQPASTSQPAQTSQGAPASQGADLSWPTKPVTIVVPFSAGGATDIMTRVLADILSEDWGVSVLVENLPGGSSLTGIADAIQRPADGYSMVCNSATVMITQYTTDTFIPFSDYTPVAKFFDSNLFLIVRKDLPCDTLEEFIALVQEKPGDYTMALSGTKSIYYVMGELFAQAADLEFSYIPYDGGAPAATAVAGGHVDACMIDYATFHSLMEAEEIKVIGYFDRERSPVLPDVQTAVEAGLSDLIDDTYTVFVGILMPNGVDQAIMDKINDSLKAAMEGPKMTTFLAENAAGSKNGYMPQADYIRFLETLDSQYAEFLKD